MNSLIINALKDITYNGEKIPVSPLVYKGTSTTYITFYTWLKSTELWADGSPLIEGNNCTVDLFCKGNYIDLLADIKNRLRNAGFYIAGIGPEIYEDDTGYYHIPINIYREEKE